MAGKEIRFAYKPRIEVLNTLSAYNTKITFRNPEGKDVTGVFSEHVCVLPRALNALVSGKTPNVTKEALQEQLKVLSGKVAYGDSTDSNLEAIAFSRAEFLINFYADKVSEREGKDVITQSEQFEIMKQWYDWFADEDQSVQTKLENMWKKIFGRK